MNFKLAREIYGGQPWMVDPISFSSLFNILQDLRNGVKLEFDSTKKLNSNAIYNLTSKELNFVSDNYDLKRAGQNDDLISIVNLDGPITKNGGASSYGMRHLSSQMDSMTNDNRVQGHIIIADSGGGASNATVFMRDSINRSKQAGKPVVSFIEKGGLAASAAMDIISGSDYIFSEEKSNMVGSIGTMIEMAGYPKQHTRKSDGAVFVRAYATDSVHKNEEFEEAIQGNIDLVVNNILDPVNKEFKERIKANRPNVKESQLSGKIFKAGETVGTLIDEIGSFESAVSKVLELRNLNQTNLEQASQGTTNKTSLIKNEGIIMNLSQLKSEHPKLYAEAVNEGVSQERDRTGAWLAHLNTDSETVVNGIKSGEGITQSVREELLIKANAANFKNDLKSDSAKEIKTEESKTKESSKAKKEDSEVDAFYAQIDAKLKKS